MAGRRGSPVTWPQDVVLARRVERLPRHRGLTYEPKWDGYRALLYVQSTGVRVQSRRSKELTAAFPDVVADAAAQLPAGVVLDGELVVWGGDRLDFTALAQRVIAPRNAARLAETAPATFMAFDLLAIGGKDLRDEPLSVRREVLVQLLAGAAPPLQLTPSTDDPDVAEAWLREYAAAQVGIEGLVIKALDDPYRGGQRIWQKLRASITAEAIVGAVTGSVHAPERLVLGLPGRHGELIVAGGTSPLKRLQQAAIAPLLLPAAPGHPWPRELPSGRMGAFGAARRLPVTLVEPALVVEVAADSAFEYGRWRHLVRFVRVRPDLSPADVAGPYPNS